MRTNIDIINEVKSAIKNAELKRTPYCIHSWSDVCQDMDLSANNILDKILLATKEMTDLGINHFQSSNKDQDAAMRKIFNLSSSYSDFDIWIAGYNYGMSARIARVHVSCIYGNYDEKRTFYIGEIAPENKPKSASKYMYNSHYNANEEQIEKVYEYLLALIEKTKVQIEKTKQGPTVADLYAKAFDYLNEELEGTKYDCEKMHGKRQMDSVEYDALVVKVKGKPNSMFSQAGTITIAISTNGEYKIGVRSCGCGGYTSTLTEWNEEHFKKALSDGAYFLTH